MKRNRIVLLPIAVLCFCASAGTAQFYYPDRKEYQTPQRYGLEYESVVFQSRDGTLLHGWFVPATNKPVGTVVHFHGNAQNMTAHFSFVQWLPEHGFNLFLFDYRGYGKSKGTPSRVGVYEDGVAAIEYIKSRKEVDQDKILILGQSLGGANAIAVIAQNKFDGIRGVAIEAAFYSYKSIAAEKGTDIVLDPEVKKALLAGITDEHSPGPLVHKIAPIPLVLIHGTSDHVVTYKHSEAIFKKAKEPKEFWTISGGGHVEAFTKYGGTYRQKLVDFFKACLKTDPVSSDKLPAEDKSTP